MSLSYSEAKKISDRYAKAAYAHAAEQNAVEPVLTDFQSLAQAVRDSKDLSRLVKDQTVSEAEKLAFFDALLAKANPVSKAIVAMLIRKKRIDQIGLITESYQQQADAAQGVTPVEVLSAKELSDKQLKEIEQALAKETKRAIRLSTRVKPELIGGLVIRMAGRQLDGSVAGQLKRLQQRLAAS
ncbi:MAG: ATP synthase F1 subunit delta [Rickettsiales bacterium]|nr:ATP synthase F1 subunit delta [Rickettsiales bacterium]|tara:strand:- start:1439 stop:1990 length:552 start_codon:yes stop_codon:yes gene_type:complete